MEQRYLTIRSAARKMGIPEFSLRRMFKQQKVPGYTQGNRFYVDTLLLQEWLDQTCKDSVKVSN